MDISKVICIETAAHTDFELYLLSEKYGIPYDFLHEYKGDETVSKFWFESPSLLILAVEAVSENGQSIVEAIAGITEAEKAELVKIPPIPPGLPAAEYQGSLAEKREEFDAYAIERAKYREEMLARDYDPGNIVCLGTGVSPEGIFAICLQHDIDFALVMDFIDANRHIEISKIWLERETSDLVAYSHVYETVEFFEVVPGCLIPKSAISWMSRVPVDVPEIKTSPDAIAKYVSYQAMGYSIQVDKFDRLVDGGFFTDQAKYSEDISADSFTLEELEMLMHKAVKDEDYESAAFFRDEINKLR